MKMLFLCRRDLREVVNGGGQATKKNYLSFCSLMGEKSVDVFNFETKTIGKSYVSKILKRFYLLRGFYWGLNRKKLNHIVSISSKYDYVFIDSSFYGIIASYLKKSNFQGKVICHFHNVELVLGKQKALRNPFSLWELPSIYYNEKKGYKYSDFIVSLNLRDANILKDVYGMRKLNIIPISMVDDLSKPYYGSNNSKPVFLFFGSNHYANYQGIKWFINNILDHVEIKLQIVGTGMDKLKKEFSSSKIEILGFVPDLSEIIKKADFILSPIFKGSGMKVKTCLALMYGKNIIGTKETFEGYDIDPNKAGALCNDSDEFIKTINSLCSKRTQKFNQYSRSCYEEKYSFLATLDRFEELLN